MGLDGTEAKTIKIFTLGRFVVEIDGAPMRFETRAQRKPLELLKALVALGGETISTEKLGESLWPDTDGDQAGSALSTTLYRLRKLIGPGALILRDGRLTLHSKICWADSWAFTELVDVAVRKMRDGDHDAAWGYAEEALGLYRGPFLDGEFELPEILSARAKLHSLFLRHIEQLGEFFLNAGQPPKAITLYQKGLEVDELAEQLYLQLMRCYRQLGRNAEGISVYKRLRETFLANGGIEPSPEADAIHQELISKKEKPPPGKLS